MRAVKKTAACTVFCLFLLGICLGGCGKSTYEADHTFSADDTAALKIVSDTWKVKIAPSADDKIHVRFQGGISKEDDEPKASLGKKKHTLNITQKSSPQGLQDQIALGKKGEIEIRLPENIQIPIVIQNGSSDIHADGISAADLSLDNDSGYAFLNNLSAGNLEVSSKSGDISLKNGKIADIAVTSSSGYISVKKTQFDQVRAAAKSGEVNISVSFDNAEYSIETEARCQGTIGSGRYKLEITSESGTLYAEE